MKIEFFHLHLAHCLDRVGIRRCAVTCGYLRRPLANAFEESVPGEHDLIVWQLRRPLRRVGQFHLGSVLQLAEQSKLGRRTNTQLHLGRLDSQLLGHLRRTNHESYVRGSVVAQVNSQHGLPLAGQVGRRGHLIVLGNGRIEHDAHGLLRYVSLPERDPPKPLYLQRNPASGGPFHESRRDDEPRWVRPPVTEERCH